MTKTQQNEGEEQEQEILKAERLNNWDNVRVLGRKRIKLYIPYFSV
jgi:hypothetical protein